MRFFCVFVLRLKYVRVQKISFQNERGRSKAQVKLELGINTTDGKFRIAHKKIKQLRCLCIIKL